VPWILFEAGALAKAVRVGRVVPYLFGMTKANLTFPLAQFQAVDADEAGTRALLISINNVRKDPLSNDRIFRIFERAWPDLKKRLDAIVVEENSLPSPRPDRELLEEMLELTRQKSAAEERKTGQLKNKTDDDKIKLSNLSDNDIQEYFAHLEYQY